MEGSASEFNQQATAVALQPTNLADFDRKRFEYMGVSLPAGADRTAVLCALAVLLERYSGQTEATFSLNGGKRQTVTVNLSGAQTFRQLLERMPEAKEQDNERFTISIPRVLLSRLEGAQPYLNGTSSPLILEVACTNGETECALLYATDQNSYSRAHVLVRQLEQALTSALKHCDEKLSELDMVPPEERHKLLVAWNSTEIEVPVATIHSMVESQARAKPHAIALIAGEQKVTYGELNARANRLAHRLRRHGLGPEQLVGIFVESSIEAIIGTLGVLKAGAAYVPLDVSHPPQRIQSVIRLAGLSWIVTTGRQQVSLPRGEAQIVLVGDERQARSAEDSLDPEPLSTPDNLAYVMFTSGSTGEPKGVMGIHRAISNGIPATLFDKNRSDEVCCLNAPLSVGISLLGLFLPLGLGVPLVVLSDEEMKDIIRFVNVIREQKITNLALTPHVLREVLNLIAQRAEQLPSLRTVMVGGAGVTADLVESFDRLLPQAVLHNGYGSSELGSIATKGLLTGSRLSRSTPAGRPIPNTKIYLLDAAKKLVPLGAVGEIYVGSKHLARGYLNRPDLDAERFLPNPFTGVEGDRLFRTGDLGVFHSSGELEFVGRTDHQVKIRGFRVELGEVESVLSKCPAVEEAAAAVYDLAGENRLVGYIVARSGADLRERDLRAYLRLRLPDYMVPSVLMFLTSLPVSPAGKLDRGALPAPDASHFASAQTYREPRSLVEASLVEIWEGLLGLDRIGIGDNFVDLGGDSLFALKLSVRILEVFGLEISMDQLLENPTVEQLAALLSRGGLG